MKGLGVKQDDAQAYAWLLLAIRSANIVFRNPEVDQSDFMHADLERLAGRLKRADISAAEEWVSKWLETHRPK
jgi:hypothetical protein